MFQLLRRHTQLSRRRAVGATLLVCVALGACGEPRGPWIDEVLAVDHERALDILGRRFGDAPGHVAVGGRAAAPLIWSPSRLRVRVPASAWGAVLVVVTVGGTPSNAVEMSIDGSPADGG